MLKRHGDDHRIEWGTLHLIAPGKTMVAMPATKLNKYIRKKYTDKNIPLNTMDYQGPNGENPPPEIYHEYESTAVHPHYPVLMCEDTFTLCEEYEDFIAVDYDDIKSIQYFGENIEAYWRKDGDSFMDMLQKELNEYEEIKDRVAAFEEDLTARYMVTPPPTSCVALPLLKSKCLLRNAVT
jgi:hypothetical protein